MADNVTVDNVDLTDYTVATDDDGTAQHQYVKVEFGADNTQTKVTATAGLPVKIVESGTATPITDGGSTISVDDGAGSLTVDGTVAVSGTVAVTQSGTWDEVGINDSGNSITVDNAAMDVVGGGTEATAHRVTIASDSTGVLSVDDNGSTLSVDDGAGSLTVDGSVAATQSGTWTVQPGNTANTTAWKVDGSAVTQPVSVASIPSHAVTNAGTFVVQENGAAATSLALIDDVIIADDAAFTPATTKVAMAGFQADESSTDSVDEGDGGAARMTLDRKVIVTHQPHSAGGATIYRSIDLDEGTLEVIKNSPGTVYGMWVANTATTTRFVKFYDATSGTAGTGTPVLTIPIPGNTSDDVAGVFNVGGIGIAFATGICFGATTAVADADTGAPGTNDVIANVFYK